MFWNKVKLGALALIASGAVALGAGLAFSQTPGSAVPPVAKPDSSKALPETIRVSVPKSPSPTQRLKPRKPPAKPVEAPQRRSARVIVTAV